MNLYVGNLTQEVSEVELSHLFAEFGNVKQAKIIRDPETSVSKGYGFVELFDKNAAIDAMDYLDMSYFRGNIIQVREARQNKPQQQGGYQQGGRYGNNNRSQGGAPRRGGFNPQGGNGGGQRRFNPRGGGYQQQGSYGQGGSGQYGYGQRQGGGQRYQDGNDNRNDQRPHSPAYTPNRRPRNEE